MFVYHYNLFKGFKYKHNITKQDYAGSMQELCNGNIYSQT